MLSIVCVVMENMIVDTEHEFLVILRELRGKAFSLVCTNHARGNSRPCRRTRQHFEHLHPDGLKSKKCERSGLHQRACLMAMLRK
jgi:hypothetical protein